MSIPRAQLLIQQNRHDAAEAELRQALAADPDSGEAHTLLAVCLAKSNRRREAYAALDEAIRLRPDWAYPHFVRGHLLTDTGEWADARAAGQEAQRLDPTNADAAALLSQIDALEGKWEPALAHADRGLALDAEHPGCANLRAHALTKLGRHAEAAASIEATLRGDPENPNSHANLGWQKLHAGKPREALDHFREALRLEPGHEWARAGLVEALKARNPIYRLLLGYFLWMSTLSSRARNGLVIGGWLGYQLADAATRSNPGLEPWLRPLLWTYIAFVVLTWLGVPLFNLMLRLSPHGRHALDAKQRRGSNVFGVMAAVALGSAGAWALGAGSIWLDVAAMVGIFTLPVSGWMALQGTTRFRPVAVAIGVVAAAGLSELGLGFSGNTSPMLFNAWLWGTLGLIVWINFGGRGRVINR